MRYRQTLVTLVLAGATAGVLWAQAPPAAPAAGRGAAQGGAGRVGGGGATYPAQQRQLADAAIIARGKTIYSINCTACHGVDARGGDQGGPNLLRSAVILNDQHGELIMPIVRGERAAKGMPPLTMDAADITAIAEFLHSLAAAGRARGATVPLNVLVGNATAGQRAFETRCASCHSPTGDLKGIGARNPDPTTLQNLWIAGGAGGGRGANPSGATRPTTVTVTLASGQKVEGRLARIDDFVVSLVDVENATRTFTRDGERPKVEVRGALDGHLQLLSKYTDDEIHNLTAYLVTLK